MRNTKEKGAEYLIEIGRDARAITLIALIVTTIFCYDEFIKSSNNKGFLLQTI